MLETELRELFERQTSGHQPPAAITSQQVIRQGRSRLRMRRAGTAAAPLLAAAAVAAVVVTAALPGPVPGGPRQHQLPPPPAVAAAPQYFDPLRPYASFGWLPAGTQVISGTTGTVFQTLNTANPDGTPAWTLTIHAGGQCSTASRVLHCDGESALFDVPMTTQLPDINRLPAYWNVNQFGQGILVFEYARDGWAELEFRDQAETATVAERITFGTSTATPVFPVQLTGLPGWQLRYEMFNPTPRGPLAAGVIGFASGAAIDAPGPGNPDNYPTIDITKAGSGGPCYFNAGQSSTSVIAGYSVTITRVPAGREAAVQQLCAADADGLTIYILVNGNQPALDVTQVFAHLRLLGPDPAQWTTKPVT